MGATYTRQSTYADGDTITADHTNDEFDQLLAAFAASTGHTHDGTAGEGGPISSFGSHAITFGSGTSGTDVVINFDGESNDGIFKWMEDEDYFEFSDDILIATNEKIQFRDTAIFINSSANGQLDIVADTEIQIAATTIDMNGNVDISGTLTVGGAVISEAELEILDGATVTTAELNILDGVTSTAAEINLLDGVTSTTAELNILDGVTSTAAELNILDGKAFLDEDNLASNSATGIASQQSIKAYVDGITTTNIVSTGALNSGSITSGFGNIDNGSSTISTTGLISGGSLDIDSVLINGATIGHTDDTDLITLADGVVTVAGEVSVTTLDIGGTNVTSTAAELNILDGVTSTAAELNILDGVTSTAAELNILDGVTTTTFELNVLDGVTAVVGELNALDLGSTAIGTAVVSKAVVLDANKDYTGIRNFSITGDLSIGGSSTIVDSVTMTANNAVVFEGATADAHETTLTSVDATADRTISLPNVSGTIPVLAAVSTVAITSTPEELNILDGVTSTAAELNLLDGVTSTTAELNILDGVTSTAAELNLVDGLVGIVAKTSATGSALLPTGNTSQRDGSPATGAFRFNSTLTAFEGYNGSAWGSVGGGATGGGTNEMFYENDQTASASYTIPANRNALTTGPITIADGVTITVSDGSRLVVI